ncbi:hypothetical protein E4U15_008064 [Claviceps sp. LM218 group G6]|nr:hypothetical protein E4U15_008064 [Claviceps sp. LM218 group G6]
MADAHDYEQHEEVDQTAKFFDPNNAKAADIRNQVAMETLDELLDYLLNKGGAVGILDATNGTLKRRQDIVQRIREKEPKLGILFIESICQDPHLLEANMRLKLSGPDLGTETRTLSSPWKTFELELTRTLAPMFL